MVIGTSIKSACSGGSLLESVTFWPAAMNCEVFVMSTAQDSGLERISVCQECPDRIDRVRRRLALAV